MPHHRRNPVPEQRSAQLAWYYRNKERIARERQEFRRQVLAMYGDKCECCSEAHFEFLTLDHPNNDGGEDRKQRGRSGNSYLQSLLVTPNPTLRILCFNCNFARNTHGVCPHESER